ncbi:MAG: hypothetical protein C3F07_13770 [Anaerolineales bacterium]|nr:MAG: hypothetical protein C3F07_13770 [Anaerolineales bacterium]
MVSEFIRENRGKSLLIAGIVLMWLVLWALFAGYGYSETWELWGVGAHPPIFRDFQLIPGSAESFRHGFEPTIENPYDPGQRIFNYPAFWRLFFYTGITTDDTVWIVVIMFVLYFAGVILFPQKLTIPGALLMLLVVFSPASMLLYERGNADLFVFFICAMIVLASRYSANLAAALIVFGAIVKMFPLFGITTVLKESKQRFYRLAIVSILFMLVYGVLTFRSQSAAWNTTMRGDGASYGSFVLFTRLGDYLKEISPLSLSDGQWQVLFEGLALILVLIAGIIAVREANPLEGLYAGNLAAFRMGASVYVGTFLLGNNWDYRLAFLAFVIPQLSEWLFIRDKKFRWITIGVVLVTLLTAWGFLVQFDLPFIPLKDPVNRIFVVDEFINWLLVPGFTYLLVASFPPWLRIDLKKWFGANRNRSA